MATTKPPQRRALTRDEDARGVAERVRVRVRPVRAGADDVPLAAQRLEGVQLAAARLQAGAAGARLPRLGQPHQLRLAHGGRRPHPRQRAAACGQTT